MKIISDELSRAEVEAENPGAIVDRADGAWVVFETLAEYDTWTAQV